MRPYSLISDFTIASALMTGLQENVCISLSILSRRCREMEFSKFGSSISISDRTIAAALEKLPIQAFKGVRWITGKSRHSSNHNS